MAPSEAMQHCAAALTRAGFSDISANQGALLVTGRKRPFGQWTKSQVTLALRPGKDGQTIIDIAAGADAQSLASLATSPSERLVAAAAQAIG